MADFRKLALESGGAIGILIMVCFVFCMLFTIIGVVAAPLFLTTGRGDLFELWFPYVATTAVLTSLFFIAGQRYILGRKLTGRPALSSAAILLGVAFYWVVELNAGLKSQPAWDASAAFAILVATFAALRLSKQTRKPQGEEQA